MVVAHWRGLLDFAMVRFCCIEANHSHYPRFVQKQREIYWSVHIDPPENNYWTKDIRFCAFTLCRFCEAQCHILEYFFHKPPLFRSSSFRASPNASVSWISTFDSKFEYLLLCSTFVRISVNTFTKMEQWEQGLTFCLFLSSTLSQVCIFGIQRFFTPMRATFK